MGKQKNDPSYYHLLHSVVVAVCFERISWTNFGGRMLRRLRNACLHVLRCGRSHFRHSDGRIRSASCSDVLQSRVWQVHGRVFSHPSNANSLTRKSTNFVCIILNVNHHWP